jgi:hypothetical protein
MKDIANILDLERYPINDLEGFATECNAKLNEHGSVVLPGFIREHALQEVKEEAEKKHLAYFCEQPHKCTYLRQTQIILMNTQEIDKSLVQKDALRTIRSGKIHP